MMDDAVEENKEVSDKKVLNNFLQNHSRHTLYQCTSKLGVSKPECNSTKIYILCVQHKRLM